MANRYTEMAQDMMAASAGHPGARKGNINLPGTSKKIKATKIKPIKTKMPTSAVHKKLLTKFLNEFGKKDSGANYSGTSNYKV